MNSTWPRRSGGLEPLQRRIVLLQRGQGLVQPVAHLMVHIVAQARPAGLGRHEERVRVEVGIVGPPLRLSLRAAQGDLALYHLPTLFVEHVAGALQERGPEDVLLELRRIHLPPQDVRRREKMPLKLRKRQHAPRLDALSTRGFTSQRCGTPASTPDSLGPAPLPSAGVPPTHCSSPSRSMTRTWLRSGGRIRASGSTPLCRRGLPVWKVRGFRRTCSRACSTLANPTNGI